MPPSAIDRGTWCAATEAKETRAKIASGWRGARRSFFAGPGVPACAGARCATDFFRGSGVYGVGAGAHINRYQLFVERSLQLLRRDGRLGLVLPSGSVCDTGSAELRRHLFDRARVDSITGVDNRRGIFPIHRSIRFALLTASAGQRTDRIACRFGLTSVEDLDRESGALDISRELLSRVSGSDDLG